MGSGKTTVGRKLSSAMDLDFIDLDKYIEKRTEQSIENIFDNKGEKYFREIEHDCLKEVIEKNNFVLSCGGGTPCFFDNMSRMNRNGVTIYLKMKVNALYSRIINSPDVRPLIKKMHGNDMRNYITKNLAEREKYYKMAHHSVDAMDLEISSVVKLIL